MKTPTKAQRLAILTALALPAASFLLAQGPLAPSGGPAPTMKSLDQIEPRTPISGPTVISAPGAYYLAGPITVATGTAISVTADNVSLDLNGFTISSTSGTTSGYGIFLSGGRSQIAISNGHIKSGVTYNAGTFSNNGFTSGIDYSGTPKNVRISNVTVQGVRNYGIDLGTDTSTSVTNSTVRTAQIYGIRAGVVSDSSASEIGNTAIIGTTVANSLGFQATGSRSITSTEPTIADLQAKLTALETNNGLLEARRPVQSLAAAAPYTITQPGSYYLTGNITVASGDAIIITSDDVSLDLNGFTIRSTFAGGSSGIAVKISGDRSRLTVRNGSIVSGTTVPASGPAVPAGFSHGIYPDSSITQALVSDVRVTGVATAGVYLDTQGVVERCTARDCGGTGITADLVQNCSAENCWNNGITALMTATNCRGFGLHIGLECVNASNCIGMGKSGSGLVCFENATNCIGTSTSGAGLSCWGNATNCTGSSTSGPAGIVVTGTASFCRGSRPGGVAINAGNAIGCTVGSGTVTAPQKHLGTP